MNQAMMMKLRKMQKQLQEAQEKLQNSTFIGKSGGVCEVEVKGTREILKINILPEAFESKEDIPLIEDAIVSAINDAFKQIDAETEKIMGPYASMLGGVSF